MAPHSCSCGSCGKRWPSSSFDALLVALDQLGPVVGGEIGVERVAVALLVVVEHFLEVIVADAEHHVGIHGDEAPVAVIGEAPVAGFLRQRLDGLVVEAEIEHGVHHARHRGARARAHRDQQRVGPVAEFLAGDAADLGERLLDLAAQFLRILLVVRVVVGADLGGDGEAGRHRQAEIRHLGEAGALAAEQVAHVGAAFGAAAAEGVDPFAFGRAAAGFALRRAAFRTVFFLDFALARGRFRLAMGQLLSVATTALKNTADGGRKPEFGLLEKSETERPMKIR